MFKRIQGNARGCVVYEPLFIIPYSMFMTYASVYMLKLGLSETQIGFIASLGLVLQIFTSFISGDLTDRMGRRKALLVFDLVSWSAATLIWAVSQNFWYFLVAAVLNSFQKVPNTAWYCLLLEDTDPKDRSIVFTALQVIAVVGGLFAPLGGLLVSHFSLVPAMRIMYFIAFASMTLMFIARNYATHETEIGIRKQKESSGMKWTETFAQYVDAVKSIAANRPLLIIFGVYILFNFQMTLQNTYLSIYLVEALRFDDALIALFPAVSSAAMLLLMVFVIPRFRQHRTHPYMIWGFSLSVVSKLILIAAAPGSVVLVTISTMLAAAGSIVASPYLEAAVANSIDDEQRAKMFSLLSVLVLVFISPSGIIGGWTYTIDPRLPFVLIIAAFLLSILLMISFARTGEKQEMAV